MKEIITNFLEGNNFKCVDESFDLYTNQVKSEYFIISQYNKEELISFFDNDKTSNIIEKFEEFSMMVKRENMEYENIDKNTSLFILVKVDNLEKAFDSKEMQRAIFLIEEDYYYFRKFVLLYTSEGVADLTGLSSNESLYNYLEKSINNFEENIFFSESYFMAMEIGVKLPFFTLPEKNDPYQRIENQYHDEMDKLDDKILEVYTEFSKKDPSDFLTNMDYDDEMISVLQELGAYLNED